MSAEFLKELEDGAKKAIVYLEEELGTIHTGRATTGLISEILVDAYGSQTPLKQIANITVTDPRSMAVQPWDKGNLVQIESALRESNMGFGVVNAGENIRVNIPELTEERRNEYIKVAKTKTEEAKVTVRNIRHDVLESSKKAKNASEISEDELYYREGEINKVVEAQNKKIDEILVAKEKELKEV